MTKIYFNSRNRKSYFVIFGSAFVIFFLLYSLEVPFSISVSHLNTLPRSILMVTRIPIDFEAKPNDSSAVERNLSFVSVFSSFNWNGYQEAIDKSKRKGHQMADIEMVEAYQEKLMLLLTPFLEMEPRVPINASCTAPLLTPPTELNCKNHGNAFTGSHQTTPPKIGILVQFGFGVDVLEIYLNEVYDVVDRFFLIEATKAHFRTIRKPLMWERVKDQPRFQKFADKIVHLVMDDGETAEANKVFQNSSILVDEKKIWKMEALQETLRWTKFLQWNKAHAFFSPEDLIGGLNCLHILLVNL